MGEIILGNKGYYAISVFIILIAIVLFLWKFEKRKPKAREIVLMAVLISMSIVGRIIFFMTPQFKPMAAVIIISGVALGKEAGFLCGALSLFVSNIFFGQGPWTPWQMLAFGIIGFLAGIIFYKRFEVKKQSRKDIIYLCIYGGLATTFIYGVIVDSATVFMYTDAPKLSSFIAAWGAGLVFNIIHGVSTVIFMLFLADEMLKKIRRIKIKFGMFNNRKHSI